MEDMDDDGTRREFIVGAAAAAVAAAGIGLAACSSDDDASTSTTSGDGKKTTTTAQQSQKLPDPEKAPFDHVVIVMMENRSFDTLLGWLPGADGKQAGLTYARKDGETYETWPLAPDFQGCSMQDPFHFSAAVAEQFNDGKIDGFLTSHPENDLFPIGYYTDEDLPILAKLATSYTTFDNYFAAMLGPTWPNRFYQLSATTDVFETEDFPKEGAERPSKLDLAIFDRLMEKDLTSKYYSPGEPMTLLYQSKKYDALTVPYEQFLTDAKEGKLPHVSFVDPNYTAEAEFKGLSNDFHAYGDVRAGDAFLAEVHDAIVNSPQWGKTVMVINFDEHGGFFDHVVPPAVEDDTVVGAPVPNLKNLGFRVPAIVVSPFAPEKIETDGPYEHCSVLKMIEWRWGLEPMTVRDEKAKNLAEALDFSANRTPVKLPDVPQPDVHACDNPDHVA